MSPATWIRAGLSIAMLVPLVAPAAAPFVSPDADPEPPRRDQFVNAVGMRFVRVKAGTFLMGSKRKEQDAEGHEHPRHEVEISKDYYVGVHEVTQKQYQAIMGKNPSAFCKGGESADDVQGIDTSDFPVESVTWDDAVAFCKKLEGKNAGVRYRLPTEAEWEYACRGGHLIARMNKKDASMPFYLKKPSASLGFGEANFNADAPSGGGKKGQALDRTCKVGSYPPNALGLYDMHGNVQEWCSDFYEQEYYRKRVRKDPQGPAQGTDRVCRGGDWDCDGMDCRAATRYSALPDEKDDTIGFRVVALPRGR